ncbi:MAG TPA: formyltransferase family protein [Phycisphaerales bacterium]|nr:formyltransferase family protein [Phycisphaerales bacterium]
MLQYAHTAQRLVHGVTFEQFCDDERTRLAIERAIEVIGEASRGVSREFKHAHPEVIWHAIEAQRHILAHEYGAIIPGKIYSVATVHVPDLIQRLTPLVPSLPPRLCFMISGGGRTALNILDHIERGDLDAHVALVISSDPDAAGVQRCRDRGLQVVVMPGTIAAEVLERTLKEHHIDWVVLAGYLKLVRIPASYEGRVINIHPALLPKFGGKGMHGHHVHEAVIAAGEAQSGCTVHFCDGKYDTGPIILQMTCPVLPNDTPGTLAARVFEVEKQAYPAALKQLLAKPARRPGE